MRREKDELEKYTKEQYNNFGWARYTNAISMNELDDMYSKIHEKGSLKKFPQSFDGEAIVEVNDDPHTNLGIDNVIVFVAGTRNNPQINKVVRFQVESDTEMEIIKENIYERGAFSNTYYSFLEQYGIAREYSKKSALDYTEYERTVRRENSRTESDPTDGISGIEQNRSGTLEQTQPNEITFKPQFSRKSSPQQAKDTANRNKKKIYTKKDARSIIRTVVGEQLGFGEYYGKVSGKNQEYAVDWLWEASNQAEPGNRAGVANIKSILPRIQLLTMSL